MNLDGKKIAIMLDEQYQEMEVWYPYYRFIEAGARVDLVAPEAGRIYKSKLGYPCQAGYAAGQVRGDSYDAVVVPGGWCPDFMRRNEMMINFIQQCVSAKILLAAICHGGWIPISAGVYNLIRSLTGKSDQGEKNTTGGEHVEVDGSEEEQ